MEPILLAAVSLLKKCSVQHGPAITQRRNLEIRGVVYSVKADANKVRAKRARTELPHISDLCLKRSQCTGTFDSKYHG